jgi:diguanylate cyclase (GGDEF)-like protein/PAS domain S-box-containing protein
MEDKKKINGQLLNTLKKQPGYTAEPEISENVLSGVHEGCTPENKKIQALAEEAPLGVAVIEKDGRYIYVNSKFIEIFGYTLREIPTGREWFRKAYPNEEYRKHVISIWIDDLKRAKPGEPRPRTFRVRCINGLDKMIYFIPVLMESGNHLIIYEDITKRELTEGELKQHKETLEELVKERTVELTRANKELQQEIMERRRAEETLRSLHSELQAKKDSLELLNTIADRAYGSLDLQTVAEQAVASMMNYGQSPYVGIFSLNEESRCLDALYSIGLSDEIRREITRLPLTEGHNGFAIARKVIVAIDEITQDDLVEGAVKKALIDEGFKSIISVPLLFQDRVLGVIDLFFKEKTPVLTDLEQKTLLNIGKTIGLAIANAQYVAQIKAESMERKHAEQALRESETRLRKLFEAIPESVMIHDEAGAILHINDVGARRLEWAVAELIGKNLREIVKNENAALIPDHVRIARANGSCSFETTYVSRTGRTIVAEVNESPMELEGKSVILSVARDITERKRAERQLAYIATHDALTGLPNRVLFNDRLNLALAQAQRHQQRLAVLLLDLDRFKDINDTWGHSVGDQFLRVTAKRLKGLLRKSDTLARMGGDEFLFLVTEIAQAENATEVARKILESFQEPFLVEGHEFRTTASIGVTIFPDDGTDADTLLKNADIAMYSAKQKGRNNYQRHRAERRNY